MACIDRALSPIRDVTRPLIKLSDSIKNSVSMIHAFATRTISQTEDTLSSSLDSIRTTIRNWTYATISENLSALILLSIYEYPVDKAQKLDEKIETSDTLKKVKLTIPGSNHTLDGVEIIHDKSVEPKNRKVILYFMGNAEIWQASLGYLETLSENMECDVIAYNYRRCGLSTSNVELDADCVIQDGSYIVESLTKSGVLPKNIILWGRSFGGGIAAKVAAQKSTEGTQLNTVLERTFKNLTDVLKYLLPTYAAKKVKALMKQFKWEIKTQEALGGIKGKVLIIQNKNDALIRPPIQVKAEKPKHVSYFMDDSLVENVKKRAINSHDRSFTKKEFEEIKAIIQKF